MAAICGRFLCVFFLNLPSPIYTTVCLVKEFAQGHSRGCISIILRKDNYNLRAIKRTQFYLGKILDQTIKKRVLKLPAFKKCVDAVEGDPG